MAETNEKRAGDEQRKQKNKTNIVEKGFKDYKRFVGIFLAGRNSLTYENILKLARGKKKQSKNNGKKGMMELLACSASMINV